MCMCEYHHPVVVELANMSASLIGLGEKEKVRKKEAMEALVDEISRLEDENLAPSLRSALEVSFFSSFHILQYNSTSERMGVQIHTNYARC